MRSLYIKDYVGQIMSEILMFDDEQLAIGMATSSLYELIRKDMSSPFWMLTGPVRWPYLGFLGFIAQIAALDVRYPYHLYGVGFDNLFHEIPLTKHMQSDEIAEIIGVDNEIVKQFLGNHLTFKRDSNDHNNGQ